MDLNSFLSPHFRAAELVHTAHRDIDNVPPDVIWPRLQNLAANFLEPIHARFGQLYVTSGYRCPELNALIGGARDSAHMYACAADVVAVDKAITVTDMVRWVATASGLAFDQVIDEGTPTGSWMHIGLLRPNHEPAPRHQALVMRNGVYTPFQG